MTLKFSVVAVAIAAGIVCASTSGMATPASPLGVLKGVGLQQSNVEKTHGWHRTCRRGLSGYHKHIPGVGRVQCTARKCWTNSWGIRRCRWF
ncbi:MAG: hypothetical protein ABWZ86_00785 [Hyphomicrobium sp.]